MAWGCGARGDDSRLGVLRGTWPTPAEIKPCCRRPPRGRRVAAYAERVPAVIQSQPGRSVRPARLWLVAVVLLGVAWMHGLQCSDGMTMVAAMPAGGIHVSMDSPTGLAGPTITPDGDDPTGLDGRLLGACLALLVGVLGAMLLDRHPARRLIAVVLAATRPRHRARIRVRAPTLAQLCLLRT
jgi:hypothetical protein